MKALIAVLIACLVSAAVAVALLLRGPAGAWWLNPAALSVLTGSAAASVALMVPRAWWRT